MATAALFLVPQAGSSTAGRITGEAPTWVRNLNAQQHCSHPCHMECNSATVLRSLPVLLRILKKKKLFDTSARAVAEIQTKARKHCRFFLTWQREISTVELHIAKQDLHRHRPMRELGARRVAAAFHALHCHLSYAPPPWPRHANAAALHVPRRLLKLRRCQKLVCTATSSSAPASYSAPGRGRSARSVPLLLCC